MRIFCPTCGAPNNYNFNKPDFCSECNNDLAIDLFVTPSVAPTPLVRKPHTTVATAPRRILRPAPEPEPQYEDETEFTIPNKLDIEVTYPEREVIKAGDVIGTAIGSQGHAHKKVKKLSKKAAAASLKEFTDNLYRRGSVDMGGSSQGDGDSE